MNEPLITFLALVIGLTAAAVAVAWSARSGMRVSASTPDARYGFQTVDGRTL